MKQSVKTGTIHEPESVAVDLDTPRFSVDVKANDIAVSIPKNSGHCMIADAVKQCFRNKFKRTAFAVHVDLQTIRLTDREKGFRYIYLTPPVGQTNLLRFDHGKAIQPFRFSLKGGQIIPMHKGSSVGDKNSGYGKQAAIRRFKSSRLRIVKQRKFRSELGKYVGGMIVTQVGGNTPPTAVLAGQRRQYGLKHTLADF